MKAAEISRLCDVFRVIESKRCHEIVLRTTAQDGTETTVSYFLSTTNWLKYCSSSVVSGSDGSKSLKKSFRMDCTTADIMSDMYHVYYAYDQITLANRMFNTLVFVFDLKDYRHITYSENTKILILLKWIKDINMPLDISQKLITIYKSECLRDLKTRIQDIKT